MEVVVAGSAGFCYGVKRALESVLEAAETRGKPMFTLGPLIHNPQVIEKLEGHGVRSTEEIDEIPPGAVLVLPSHGVSREVMDRALGSGLEIIDMTCPFVTKVHRLAERLVKQGYQVVVLGDSGHTEVTGIMSRAGNEAVAVSEPGELADVKLGRRVGVVAQTTQTVDRYQKLVEEVSARAYEVRAYNTICNATTDRQKAAVEVAAKVDVMLVVGGRNSANTRRLAEICAAVGVATHHIETADELEAGWFRQAPKAGVTAGASTPDWIIDEVVENVKRI